MATAAGLAAGAVVGTNTPPAEVFQKQLQEAGKSAAARQRAEIICVGCHLFPEPNLLDQRTWNNFVLPRMAMRLGLTKPDFDQHAEGPLLKESGVFPEHPMIPEEDWKLVANYYLDTAPPEPPPQDARPEINVGLAGFAVEPPYYRQPTPLTTLVKISPATRRIFVGDDGAKALNVLNSEGELLETVKLGNVPTAITETDKGLYVTCIGNFQPSQQRNAALLFVPRTSAGYGRPRTLLRDLQRTTHAEFADLNGDGKTDFALCMFGDLTGGFSWFENLGGEQYKEHPLLLMPGAIRSVAQDFNGDGTTDLAVLMAQHLESLVLYFNAGKGNFRAELVFQKHPVYGHNSFEAVDFDKDGRLDFLVTNGDNGEYESCLKKYHGIRLYLDKGGNRYEESFFFPMNGAVRALARDFDGDGDLDIAAISFFPDYRTSPKESFVYLQNEGGLKFTPMTFRECIEGRWIVMDVGDLDGDGDLDLVLGSYIKGPTSVPLALMQSWEQRGPSVQILRNSRR